MKPNLILLFGIAMLSGLPCVWGQSMAPNTINANGGSGIAAGNTFEWAIGETMVSTFSASSVIITQGILQPIQVPATGMPVHIVRYKSDVFPNPASTSVNFRFTAPSNGILSYVLVDEIGRTLQVNNIEVRTGSATHQLDIRQLACATYILQLTYKVDGVPDETTTYKIQKLN